MYAPVLTRSDSPAPAVQVLFSSLHASTAEVTLWRLSPDGQQVVRGAEREYAVGGFVITDYEVPLGVETTYRAEQFNSAGTSLGFTDAAAITVEGDPSCAWVQDPLDPGSAVLVELGGSFGNDLKWDRPVGRHFAGGRTVALYGPPGLLSDVNLDMQTKTLPDADRLRAVLQRTGVLVRTLPPARVPRLLYVVVSRVSEQEVDAQYGGGWIRFPASGDEVSPTTRAIVVALFTWADIDAAYATWDLVKANYLTWLDVKANPPEGS